MTFSVAGAPVTDQTLAANNWTIQIGVNNNLNCTKGVTDSVEMYAYAGSSAGSALFRWDSTSRLWIYNLDTKAPPQTTMYIDKCYRLDVYVADGDDGSRVRSAPKPTRSSSP